MINQTRLTDDDLEPVAGLSSAAACIDLHLMDSVFKPVFTHQCFMHETILGFRPFVVDEEDAANIANIQREKSKHKTRVETDVLHKSFKQQAASKRLKVTVKLIPSCTACVVSFKKAPLVEDQNLTEASETKDTNSLSLSGNKRKASMVRFHDKCKEDQKEDIMSDEDMLKGLNKALPNINHLSNDIDNKCGFLESTFGATISECRRSIQNDEMEFILCLADGKNIEVNNYHNQAQKLALWFIENADTVDLNSDEGGGTWKVLYLFRVHRSNDEDKDVKFSLAGYMTLFCFYSPFKKPKAGIILRICQALILPPYQRCGLGSFMMTAVYDYAYGKYDSVIEKMNCVDDVYEGERTNVMHEIVEVNVEDPSPSFTALRDRSDYNKFKDCINPENDLMPILPKRCLGDDNEFPPLNEKDAISAAAAAKITKSQIQICYEIYQLRKTKKILEGCAEEKKEGIDKSYRLMVKKRLNHFHREEIGSCATKMEKQAKLSELYEEARDRYNSILKHET